MKDRTRPQRGTRWIDRHVTRSIAPYKAVASRYGAEPRLAASHVTDAFVQDLIDELGPSQWIKLGPVSPWRVPVYTPDDPQPRLSQTREIRHGRSTTIDYGLTRYGVPVWGASVAVTLPDGAASLLQATLRLPIPLPDLAEARAPGPWRPQLVEAPKLADGLGLCGPVGLTSKRLVLHLLDPDAVGPAGRLVNTLTGGPGPLTSRCPIRVSSRKGVLTLASEVTFEWAPPGGRKANWLVLIDVNTGAVLHAERRERDILGAIHLDEPSTPAADRRPAFRPVGTVDWLEHLRAAARTATVSSGGKREGG